MSDILHFRGDLADRIERGQMIGPDFGGRHLSVRSAKYDAGTDSTTVTLRGILPDEYRKRILERVDAQRERDRVREVFNG